MCASRSRTPTFSGNQHSSSRANLPRARQSRREQSLERSQLPTYRRSKSIASVSVPSKQEKQLQSVRSSSSSRNVQPQNLLHASSFLPRPSTSGASANKFSTPMGQQRISMLSISSNQQSKAKISPWMRSNNKDIQRKELSKEFNRIRQVLAFINCNVSLSKPVNIREFVDTLMYIFSVLNIGRELTFANYKTVLPMIMKTIGYTGNYSSSFLKTVNTMHNWPHVINILSYLCNMVDAQFCLHPELLDNCDDITKIFRDTVFKLVGKCEAEQQVIHDEFTNAVLKANGVDVENLEKVQEKTMKLQKENDDAEQHLKELQAEYDDHRKREVDLERMMAELDKQSNDMEDEHEIKMKLTNKQIDSLSIQIAEFSGRKVLLENQLKTQKYTKEDVFQLKREIIDQEQTCLLLEEGTKKLENEWHDMFVAFSKANGKLKAEAIEFNARLKMMSGNDTEVQQVFVPETGFSQYTEEEFEMILSACLSSNIHQRISDLKERVTVSEKERGKSLDTLDNLKKQISRLEAENKHQLELHKREKQKIDRKLDVLEKKLEGKKQNTLSLIDEKEDLNVKIEKYVELDKKLGKKNDELQELFNVNRKNADDVLSARVLDIANIMHKFDSDYRVYLKERSDYQDRIHELIMKLLEDQKNAQNVQDNAVDE